VGNNCQQHWVLSVLLSLTAARGAVVGMAMGLSSCCGNLLLTCQACSVASVAIFQKHDAVLWARV